MTYELNYERGTASPQDLEAYAREIWDDARAAGELPTDIGSREDFPYRINVSGSGIVVSGTALVVSLTSAHWGPVTKRIALDVWKELVLPKLKRRFGEDKIGSEVKLNSRERSTGDKSEGKKSGGAEKINKTDK